MPKSQAVVTLAAMLRLAERRDVEASLDVIEELARTNDADWTMVKTGFLRKYPKSALWVAKADRLRRDAIERRKVRASEPSPIATGEDHSTVETRDPTR